jgi:hypothetical protein
LGLLELAIAAEELGRALAPVPLIEHAVAARLLARCAPGHARLGELAEGSAIGALALRPASAGVAALVPGGAVAHLVIALDGDALVAVEDAPPGRAPANLGCAPLADRPLRSGSAQLLGRGAEARASWERAVAEWRALTAAALVGLAQGALDLALAYVKERRQFGVPIGSFQSIQHGLVDAAVALDGARLLARKASWRFDEQREDAARLAGMALLFAAETAQGAAARSLHYHGGNGFSLEYDIQLYFRRARGWMLALDDPALEYQRVADQLYGPPGAAQAHP